MNKILAGRQTGLDIALVSILVSAAIALSGGANAASVTAAATATVVAPITIAKITDLNFGSFYPSGTSGTVDVNTNGARIVTGGVLAAASGATPTAAKFDVTGAASATYTIGYTSAVTLTSVTPGNVPMALTQISDLSGGGAATTLVATGTLSAGGIQTIFIGGNLAVAANQGAGVYTGTISATVAYN